MHLGIFLNVKKELTPKHSPVHGYKFLTEDKDYHFEEEDDGSTTLVLHHDPD